MGAPRHPRHRRVRRVAAALAVASALTFASTATLGSSFVASARAAQTAIPAPDSADGTDISVTVASGGLSRHYTLFVPAHPAAKPGLLVFLHGFTRTGDAMESMSKLDVVAGQQGHFVLYPFGVDGSWNVANQCCEPSAQGGVDDLRYIDDVIASARSRYPAIGAAKVVVGGSSLGAQMAFYYSCYNRRALAGVFANDGNAGWATCQTLPPQHVLAINGEKDQRSGWAGPPPNPEGDMDIYETKNGCGPGWTSTTDARSNQHRVAKTCRPGASIDQWVAPKLDHRWTQGAADEAQYGLDTTKTVWNWVLALWATPLTPPPTAYAGTAPSFTLAPPPGAPAALPAATTTPMTSPAGSKGTDHRITMTVGGQQRSYVAFTPNAPAAKPGLLVMLHGETSNARGFETASNASVAVGSKGNFVVYPDALNRMWDAGPACCGKSATDNVDDVSFLDTVIGQVIAAHPEIGTRIAVVGFSGGGMMAFTYACQGRRPIGQVFSGNGMALLTCLRARTVRVMTVNGMKDDTVRWTSKNDNPMFTTEMATGVNATRSLSGVLGTWYWVKGTAPNASTWRLDARGLRAGATHAELTANKLDHRWTAAQSDWQTYGMNLTDQMWTWLAPIWSA